MIVDLRGIELRDRAGREQQAQKIGAGVRQLVQRNRSARDLCQDRQKSGPCRGLKNQIALPDLPGSKHGQPHWKRRRELLQALHLLGSPRVARHQPRHLVQKRQHSRR